MATSSKALKIGMIGFGSFAQFLANTLMKQGHTITATSRSDYSQLCSQLGITFFSAIEDFIRADNEVILISTSILSFSEVINSIPLDRLTKGTLFVDVLSVKEYPKDLLLQVLPKEIDILCTHPMFGPESGKEGWKNLIFAFDRIRIKNDDTCSSFLHIFEKEGCRMVEISCEEHDKQAARSQFITHTIGRVLLEAEIESTSVDTKGFQTLVSLKENTEKDSLDLYCGLYMHNRFAKQELKNLELAFETTKQKLQQKSSDIYRNNSDTIQDRLN